MSPQGFHAVPRRHTPAVLVADSGSLGAATPRFLTLVVRAYREWEQPGTDEPVQYTVDVEPLG